MLVTTLATSTIYGYWGFQVAGAVLDEIYGDHLRIHCLDLAQLRDFWVERGDRPVHVTTDRPDAALSVMLATSGCPILAFFDSAPDAMAHCMVVDGRSAPEAIRFCTGYFSALALCLSKGEVRIFGPETFDRAVGALVAEVAATIGAPIDPAATARIVQRLAPAETFGPDPSVGAVMRAAMGGQSLAEAAALRLDAQERDLIRRAADSYRPLLAGGPLTALEWPRELFSADVTGEHNGSDVRLIGGARHIYWGPYLHLPVGRWRATIQFEVSGNASGNEIEGDVCAGAVQLAKANARLPEQGYFRFVLEFANTDPNAPIEVRIRLLKGAIEGLFGLRQVNVEPVAALGGMRLADTADLPTPIGDDRNAAHA